MSLVMDTYCAISKVFAKPSDEGYLTFKVKPEMNPLPGILLVTMGKSGSVFIGETIQRTFNLPYMRDLVNDDIRNRKGEVTNRSEYLRRIAEGLTVEVMYRLRIGNVMMQNHMSAKNTSKIELLRSFKTKFIVHFRDPRSVILSKTHHALRLLNEGQEEDLSSIISDPELCRHFKSANFTEQLKIMIHCDYPLIIDWLASWLAVYDSGEFNDSMLLMSYDDLLEGIDVYMGKVFDFYGIDPQEYPVVTPPKNMNSHYRKGDPKEWRDVCDSEDIKTMNDLIPDEWFTRFPWER